MYGEWDYYTVIGRGNQQVIVDYSIPDWSGTKEMLRSYPLNATGLTLVKFVYNSQLRKLFAFLVDAVQVIHLVYFETISGFVHPLELLWNIRERMHYSFSVIIKVNWGLL